MSQRGETGGHGGGRGIRRRFIDVTGERRPAGPGGAGNRRNERMVGERVMDTSVIMRRAVRVPVVFVTAAVLMVACQPQGATTIPPACTTSCVERPHCSFHYAWDDAGNPLQAQLGCGPVFQYTNGANSGILGGTGSFCTDSPANRKALHDDHKHGYPPGYCETCLGVPAGKVFVFWTEAIGPSCPSGCVIGDAAPPF